MKIIEQSELKVKKTKMNTDHELHPNFIKPLNFRSGFLTVINGPSGAGKTTLLCSLLNQNPKKINGVMTAMSLKGCFHNIHVVSPSLHTLKHNIFEGLENTTYDTFDEIFIDEYLEFMQEQKDERDDEDPEFNLLILDDCGDNIKDKEVQKKFLKIINNRRHSNTSIIVLTQNIIQLHNSIRKNMSYLFCYNVKSLSESEAIYSFTKQPKKMIKDFFDFIFDKPNNFLYIDMTMRTGRFQFYKNFDKIEF